MDRAWHTSHTLSRSWPRPRGSQRAGRRPVREAGAEVDGHPVPPSLSQVPPGAWALARAQPPGPPRPQALHSAPPSPGDRGNCVEPPIRGRAPAPPPRPDPLGGCSTIALIGENLQECSSDGITWNCFLGGGGRTKHSFLCRVLVWMGQLCVGVFLFFFFFVILVFVLFCFGFCFDDVYNLPHSVFYKDSTSSPLPSPTQAFKAVRRCLNSTKYQSKSNFAHIYIYIRKETFQ